jgi:hypothetical protein
MPPQAISLGLFVIQELLTNSPELFADLQKLFSGTPPTAADWLALHAKVLAKSYRDYVPETALPPVIALVPAIADGPVKVQVLRSEALPGGSISADSIPADSTKASADRSTTPAKTETPAPITLADLPHTDSISL